MGFSQALSGLNASSTDLNVVSNNIANSQTVGFKSSSTRFADVYAGSSSVGLGTQVTGVVQDFASGSLTTTSNGLDLAISGEGFFTFKDGLETVYSRNGQLTLNNEGYLENDSGARLVGTSGAAIQIPTAGMQASATAAVDASLNLNSNSAIIDPALKPFDSTDTSTYSYANTASVYDSLGNSHSMTMYFTKTGINEWAVHSAIDGQVLTEDLGAGPVAASQTVTFDTSGLLVGGAAKNYSFDAANGSAPIAFELDLTGSTQFGNDSELSSIAQDGYTSGSLLGFAIDDTGRVIGSYANDQTQILDQVQLASFRNTSGLKAVGSNSWAETSESGQALLGIAGTGKLGSVEAGVVEESNVDLTAELVNLIIAQRNFQANSQSVKTQSDVLQQAVNLGS
jgi:flagellar hook protein FlgE